MSEHKFEIGDRIRLIECPIWGIRRIGEVFTVTERPVGSRAASIPVTAFIARDGRATWAPTEYFTLHAKAGQFVPGDRVVRREDSNDSGSAFKHGDVLTVVEPSFDSPSIPHNTFWARTSNGEGPWWTSSSDFRLATAEEIAWAHAPAADAEGKTEFKVGDEIELISESYGDLVRGDRVTVIKTETYAGGAPGVKWKPNPGRNTQGGYAERFRLVKKATGTEGATGRKPGEPISPLPGPFVVGDVVERIESPISGVRDIGDRVTLIARFSPSASPESVFYVGRDNQRTWDPCTNHRLAIPAGGFRLGDLVEATQDNRSLGLTAGKRYVLNISDHMQAPAFITDQGRPRGTLCATHVLDKFRLISRPDADGWHAWAGGENPVPGMTIEWKLSRRDDVVGPNIADALHWSHTGIADIIAFRIIATEAADVTIKGDTPPLRFTSPATPTDSVKADDLKPGDHAHVTLAGTVNDNGTLMLALSPGSTLGLGPSVLRTAIEITKVERPFKVGDRVISYDDEEGTIRYIEGDEATIHFDDPDLGLSIEDLSSLTRI